MTKVRWGILSTANIAQKAMIPAIGRSENAEVVAIASSSRKASRAFFSSYFGRRRFIFYMGKQYSKYESY